MVPPVHYAPTVDGTIRAELSEELEHTLRAQSADASPLTHPLRHLRPQCTTCASW